MMNSQEPTVFHITHAKAGSQWVYAVLQACAPKRVITPQVQVAHFFTEPIQPGKIYPAAYVSRAQFEHTLYHKMNKDMRTPSAISDAVLAQNQHHFLDLKMPIRVFVVIRDFRDTLISLYFSLKVSHPVISDSVAEGRKKLVELRNDEEGLLYLIENRLNGGANIQRSWLQGHDTEGVHLTRYEDLIADEQKEFAKIIDHCQIDISPARLTQIVRNNSFSQRAGRKPGEEDVNSHFRKGIAGDWKNYFTDRVREQFKGKFGQLLIDTGYEKDLNW